MPSFNRKREWEGERDGARPNKKSTASASTAKPASASNNPDPPVLIGPYDGHRRYDEWKGQMYGFPRVIPGSGAMFPTNYQINFTNSHPWECPLVGCRKCFQQSSQLGAHFSVSFTFHAVFRRGLFWKIGERKTPDKDGKFRSIVVKMGYFEPDSERTRDDVRQPPENWESKVNPRAVKDIKLPSMPQPEAAPTAPSSAAPSPAAPSSTTFTASASGPSAVTAPATPRSVATNPVVARPLSAPGASAASLPAIRHTAAGYGLVKRPSGNSIHEAIDISSDEDDVKPSLAELQRKSNSATSASQKVEAQSEAKSSGGNGAEAQEDPFQDDPLRFDGPDKSVHDRNQSIQAPVTPQPHEPVHRVVDDRRNSETSPIWTYMIKYSKSPTPLPDDAAISELLTELPRRRDLPEDWKGRLAAFDTLSTNQLSALILYLGGTAPVTNGFQYCRVMECHLRQGATACPDPTHNGGRCRTCGFTFPHCVFLPRYLLSSIPIAKRFGVWLCCNSFYRNMPMFSNGAIQSYTGKTMARRKEDGNFNNMSKEKATLTNQPARPHPRTSPKSLSAQVSRTITPVASSTAKSMSNLTIHNKPRATHQQPHKQASATSHRSSGIFCIPENTPGQMFSLKGTDTRIIQSSRNQILKCKVLAGDGIKWQIVGGKEFRAYTGWIGEWEIPPDSQCLVKNIYPKKSFGENQTCIDVNPKKGVVKAAQNQGMGK
ncbi:hypothetical protein B0T13DRAFT_526535 [Neurospora crassa]|nr:hypothetical protein B0T13DRAFT_526535 [Neurospora crassa]